MNFIVLSNYKEQNFSLIYEDFSFDIEPFNASGGASVLVNYLNIEFDFEGVLQYVWGYCPLENALQINFCPQEYEKKNIKVSLEYTPEPGISVRLNPNQWWPTYINKSEGCICIGDISLENKKFIFFAPGSIASLIEDQIVAFWLYPKQTNGFIEIIPK